MKSEYHILNLGAGVQSTRLYLMFLRGEITPQIHCAIIADVQEEPQAVYRHLEWLKSLKGPEILVRTAGKLGDDLISGRRPQGAGKARFASIPAFTTNGNGVGRTKRQCSKEYKTEVIERTIRRDVLGLKPRQRIPKGVVIHQYFGISLDEGGRARRIQERMAKTAKWAAPHFPLIERFITRADCLTWLADKLPHPCPRSACVFCPYHSDAEWLRLKEEEPESFQRAVQIDEALRDGVSVMQRDMTQTMYLHRSCKPLAEVAFDPKPKPRDLQMNISFAAECEGLCGV